MCGICGIIDFKRPPSIEPVERMTRKLRHRGPDMGGTHEMTGCVLGHRRLSILDLSDAAVQPMLSPDRATAVVFNGEIYNFREIREELERLGHRFQTTSDTEVVLALYLAKQEAMLEYLNGMFSLAIWDDRKRRLFLARDRMGKKPLYYFAGHGRLSFASELSSLVVDPRVPTELSSQALFEYLLYDFIPAPHTIYRDVNKLPAAHYAIFDSEGLRIRRYWNPPQPDASADYRESTIRLKELLSDAVRMRLVSDVPLGAFLSGGIDSTLVTSFMQGSASETVKTFSISFPGTTYDESRWSRLAAEHLRTEHSEYPVEYDVAGIFPRMVAHFGEPFGDSSAIPTWLLSEKTRGHVTVALSGDGGDELFAGYERYLARRFQVVYDRLPALCRERLIEPFVRRLPATTAYYGTSLSKKLKLFIDASQRIREEPLAVIPRTFTRKQVMELTGSDYEMDDDPALEAARQWVGLDPVSRMQFTDIQTYMAEDILTKVDRMSMAHALEVRSPLLDHRVVELACSLPSGFKLTYGATKKILKDAARGQIPDAILKRSKYGFQVPLGDWFKAELKSWARERLFDASHGMFNRAFVERIWNEHLDGRADHAHRLWLLLVFNEWEQQGQSGIG